MEIYFLAANKTKEVPTKQAKESDKIITENKLKI